MKYCPRCAQPLPPEARFCPRCQLSLVDPPVPPSPYPSVPAFAPLPGPSFPAYPPPAPIPQSSQAPGASPFGAPGGPSSPPAWATATASAPPPWRSLVSRNEAINLAQFTLGAVAFGIAATLIPSYITDVSLRTNLVIFSNLLAGMFLFGIGLTLWLRLLAVQENTIDRELIKSAAPVTLAAVLAFWLIPVPALRAITVIGLSVLVLGLTVALAGVLVFRLLGQGRHFPRALAIGLAVVLVGQMIVAGNLNSYADSQLLSGTTLIQSYYAQVAVSVAQGNAIAAGHAPAGLTFNDIAAQDENVSSALATFDTPGALVDYGAQIKAWADQVTTVALGARTGGKWQNVPGGPAPFSLTMSFDGANAAFDASGAQIADRISFDNYALANKDAAGALWVAARMDSQNYWLEGVYASADTNWLEANFRFLEPSSISTGSATGSANAAALAAPLAEVGANVHGFSSPPPLSGGGSWGAPRPWPHGSPWRWEPACYPQLQGKISGIISTGLAIEQGGSQPASADWLAAQAAAQAAQQADILPLIGPSPLPPTPVAAPAKDQGPPPPQGFYNQCIYGGGVVTYVLDPGQNNIVALPANEGGWYCANPNPGDGYPNASCWSYLSGSGSFSAGGGSDCLKQNLVPAPLGPLGNVAQNLGNWANTITSGGSPSTWDGTYQLGATGGRCAGSLLDSLPASATAAMEASFQSSMNTLFHSTIPLVVKNDTMSGVDLNGNDLAIDSSGLATMTPFSVTGATVYGSMTFSRQGSGGAGVTVKITFSEPNFDCTFTFAGNRS